MGISEQDILNSLRQNTPEAFHVYLPDLVQIISDVVNKSISPSEASSLIEREPHLKTVLEVLNGSSIRVKDATLAFGSNNQTGDITIGSFAGENIVNVTINISAPNLYIEGNERSNASRHAIKSKSSRETATIELGDDAIIRFVSKFEQVIQHRSNTSLIKTLIGISGYILLITSILAWFTTTSETLLVAFVIIWLVSGLILPFMMGLLVSFPQKESEALQGFNIHHLYLSSIYLSHSICGLYILSIIIAALSLFNLLMSRTAWTFTLALTLVISSLSSILIARNFVKSVVARFNDEGYKEWAIGFFNFQTLSIIYAAGLVLNIAPLVLLFLQKELLSNFSHVPGLITFLVSIIVIFLYSRALRK